MRYTIFLSRFCPCSPTVRPHMIYTGRNRKQKPQFCNMKSKPNKQTIQRRNHDIESTQMDYYVLLLFLPATLVVFCLLIYFLTLRNQSDKIIKVQRKFSPILSFLVHGDPLSQKITLTNHCQIPKYIIYTSKTVIEYGSLFIPKISHDIL